MTGIIVDAAGRPLPHASVSAASRAANPNLATAGSRLNPWTSADAEGRFRLRLLPGLYEIQAKDEARGYPDPTFTLNHDSTATFPRVTVRHDDIAGLRAVVGKQGGLLEGKVVDGSGRAIASAKITVADAQSPQAYVELFTQPDGRFEAALPDKRVRLSTTVQDYHSVTPQQELRLSAGEHQGLIIRMSPNSPHK